MAYFIRSILPCAAFISCALMGTSPGLAQQKKTDPLADIKLSVSFCVAKPTKVDRLACYDELATQLGLQTQEEATKEKDLMVKYGLWKAQAGKDDLGFDSFYFRLPSNDTVQSSADIGMRPVLTLKCQPQKTDVYVDWQIPLTTDANLKVYPVSYSIDGMTAVHESWTLSSDGVALYAQDPAAMIRALKKRKTLVVSVDPEMQDTYRVGFSLDGFDEILQVLIDRCYKDAP